MKKPEAVRLEQAPSAVSRLFRNRCAILGLLRRLIPAEVKLPAAVLTVAGFASMAQMLLGAFLPTAASMLGLYLAVLAVDLMIFSAAETALDEGLGAAIGRAALTALCFAVFVLILAALREVFGAASFAGSEIAALIVKDVHREHAIEPKYVGTECPNEFVVGYGLDYNEMYRHLPYVGVLDEKVYS